MQVLYLSSKQWTLNDYLWKFCIIETGNCFDDVKLIKQTQQKKNENTSETNVKS